MEEETLEQFVGLFEYEKDYQVQITHIGDGHLEARNLWNDWVYQMRPESDMIFFTTNYGNRLDFIADDGKITAFQDEEIYGEAGRVKDSPILSQRYTE